MQRAATILTKTVEPAKENICVNDLIAIRERRSVSANGYLFVRAKPPSGLNLFGTVVLEQVSIRSALLRGAAGAGGPRVIGLKPQVSSQDKSKSMNIQGIGSRQGPGPLQAQRRRTEQINSQ